MIIWSVKYKTGATKDGKPIYAEVLVATPESWNTLKLGVAIQKSVAPVAKGIAKSGDARMKKIGSIEPAFDFFNKPQ